MPVPYHCRAYYDSQGGKMIQVLATPTAVLAAILLLVGCSDYQFKFNDRTVYTPSLFTDYALEDAALEDCIQQTIEDQQIDQAEDLELLVCTSAGINSLEGLGTFKHLEQLNLEHNLIDNIEPLQRLPRLTRLDLSDNALKHVAPLMRLTNLERVDLKGNDAVVCEDLRQLKANSDVTVDPPQHCLPGNAASQ